MELFQAVETLPALMIYISVFLYGGQLHAPASIIRRNAISLGAGASIAYIFIQLLPELESAGELFRDTTGHLSLPYQGTYGLQLTVMLGFLVFYGLSELLAERETATAERFFWVPMVFFGSYAWIICYLLVRAPAGEETAHVMYALAMGLHFLVVTHSLCAEHGRSYHQRGRWILAGAALCGWLSGVFFAPPPVAIILLFGFVAGGVLMNTMVMELPRNQRGKFLPFLLGASSYTALLIVFH